MKEFYGTTALALVSAMFLEIKPVNIILLDIVGHSYVIFLLFSIIVPLCCLCIFFVFHVTYQVISYQFLIILSHIIPILSDHII